MANFRSIINYLIFGFCLHSNNNINAQNQDDSLVVFSNLKFHSEFEKNSIANYLNKRKDTLNLFLSISPELSFNNYVSYATTYHSIVKDLEDKNPTSKGLNRRTKFAFKTVHDKYLTKYKEIDFLPFLFEKGTYNCVTSSILYAMVFDEIGIPYKVQVTDSHVYLIANPGPKSMVVETTNPKMQRNEYLYGFKKQYVSHLKSLKVISEQELENKSIDELYEEKVNDGRPARFDNLFGFQYYNMGLDKYDNNEIKASYELLQKAYFFYPSKQVKSVILPVLLRLIEKCKFKQVEDIDYLAQLARFDQISTDIINNAFQEIVKLQFHYSDKKEFCDSIHSRLINQISDSELKNELSFSFNLLMAKQYKNSSFLNVYIENALKIKQNYLEANELFAYFIQRELDKISEYKNKLKAIDKFKNYYKYDFIQTKLNEEELICHLNEAYDLFKYNYIDEGEEYLKIFEKTATMPIQSENKRFIHIIETAYRTLAVYYFYRNNKAKAQATVDRGLKYVPESRFLQTAVY